MSYMIDNIINHNLTFNSKNISTDKTSKDNNLEDNNLEDNNSNFIGDNGHVINERNINKILTITETPVIETLITETEYTDHNKHIFDEVEALELDIASNNLNDILILLPDYIKKYLNTIIKKIATKEFKFIFVCLFVLNILILISMLSGINSDWYKNNGIEPVNNMYVISAVWIIVIILSYVSIVILWENVDVYSLAIDFTISNYFIIGGFLTLLWATSYFQANNIGFSFWLSLVNMIYQFWLIIVIWHINKEATIFLFPSLIVYIYIFYNMVKLVRDQNVNV